MAIALQLPFFLDASSIKYVVKDITIGSLVKNLLNQ